MFRPKQIEGGFYHVYNRGVDSGVIFTNNEDRTRFLNRLTEYIEGLEIVAFCLMGNHYHLLLWQHEEGAISAMMKRLSVAYTKYFNIRYERNGCLFGQKYQYLQVNNDNQLLQLIRYIHLNPIGKNLEKGSAISYLHSINTEWSSHRFYLGNESSIPLSSFGKDLFNGPDDYEKFMLRYTIV